MNIVDASIAGLSEAADKPLALVRVIMVDANEARTIASMFYRNGMPELADEFVAGAKVYIEVAG